LFLCLFNLEKKKKESVAKNKKYDNKYSACIVCKSSSIDMTVKNKFQSS
jgi:hypothetical protein